MTTSATALCDRITRRARAALWGSSEIASVRLTERSGRLYVTITVDSDTSVSWTRTERPNIETAVRALLWDVYRAPFTLRVNLANKDI